MPVAVKKDGFEAKQIMGGTYPEARAALLFMVYAEGFPSDDLPELLAEETGLRIDLLQVAQDDLIKEGLLGYRHGHLAATATTKEARHAYAKATGETTCHSCGCTESWGCEDGCWWVSEGLCSACSGKAAQWPPPLPEALRDWPLPKRQRTTPARWLSTATQFRAFFEEALAQHGEDALAEIYHSVPRGASARPTRWFCPDLPMLATGRQEVVGGKTVHIYLLPARAALLALDAGLVKCRKDKGVPT
ncbi:hypothetical protein Dxin01_00845 [Deinococcus xinjiangensis]|uniref:Uncharacterized protein n=1 Tax=Deinococcus xinjiangensis TaxID=457454 RepID=A0ABP9V762_9DEIO